MNATCLTFVDGYCSTVQGLPDWFEIDLGFTELLFIQIDLCVVCDVCRHMQRVVLITRLEQPAIDLRVVCDMCRHMNATCLT